jgi:flagellar motor switch protein FliN/FliY
MTALEEIGHLADVPIDVEIELARKTMPLRDILGLSVGSVIKMPRSAGENIDILAGGALIGSGEVVIIEEIVGIRITDFKEAE